MTLEQLRIFVGVAEREHMTRAAEALNVTQSAASAAIAALEARHGVPLFHRVGRGIELSEAGRMFLVDARAVLGRAASAELALAEYAGLERGTLRLVASQTIAGYWLPRQLAAFHARYPAISIELAIDNTEGAAARVLDGAVELGFVEGVIDEPALAHWTVANDRMVLVSDRAADTIDEDWIRAARWIVREQGSGTRSSFEEVLRQRGVDPSDLTVALMLPSNEAVRSAVEAGAGVAVLSQHVVAPAIAAGTLHDLPLGLPRRSFYALRHKERYRTRAADALTDLIKETGK
ncbi:LysR family transcriptional regulator [Sphingomonas sp. Leaf230]|uniref:LysR family transcriptional regulator n=1 Tax=Sphingomonas sp. Leaf230 TaxID=1735694 RepID=UPI0006F29B07|nr:LysR family transcriptional regulator [Sphingomonas sp. Leaf230]KQN02343.1 LysR family transcriptional regulator [Sphingomonas sp. Leaf230]